MVQLQGALTKIEETGAQVVAISYDSVEVLKKFADQQKITFPLLSDPESTAIKAFGILNTEAKGRAQGVPYPGTFVVDKSGVIQAKIFRKGYVERHSPDELIKAVKELK